MKKSIVLFYCLVLSSVLLAQQNFVQYVNPFIGTGGHGHTYPGATLPHGMVQLSPDTRLDGWDGCSGYHYSDSFIYGFSHTHLSGTGVSDYGDILLMPMNGNPSPDNKIYGAAFDHRRETAKAGYYQVNLEDDNIDVELTATERVGFHHYKFSTAKDNNIILDLQHRDEVIESYLNIEDSVTVTGLRRSKAWADDQYVFFVMKFSRPILKSGIWNDDKLLPAGTKMLEQSSNLKAFFQFDLANNNDIYIKLAISSVSIEGAKLNMAAELPGWDFVQAREQAAAKWESELGKIEVKSEDKEKLAIFYTALYHTAIVPNINMDVNGLYRGRDHNIHKADGFTYYSVFSLWDTYRAANPLYTIIDRQRTLDYIKTFLLQYQQGGRLPVWELAGCETDCMIGYHSIPVIVDAYTKGIRGFDTDLAMEAMEKSANWKHFGLPDYIAHGMIQSTEEQESVSKTLEYAYDDYCIAQFAKAIGKDSLYKKYIHRAQYYKNLLDTKTGFMRPRNNGDWISPFDPREVNNNFTEANSWQYSFYFPQDVAGYLQLAGGPGNLEKKLDALFTAPAQTTGRDQSDITGLIGQYAHGNEPSHHIIYLYDFTAGAYKAQKLVNQVMKEMYHNTPGGLIGNEDCGQMSAWYVLSALGFYPVTPGTNSYMIGTPAFKTMKLHLENNKTFSINAPNLGDDYFYVQSFQLQTANNKVINRDQPYIQQDEIANGGEMNFTMTDKPAALKMIDPAMVEPAIEHSNQLVINPVINGGPVPFRGTKKIAISSPQKEVVIYYTVDGTEPTVSSKRYTAPFTINNSVTVKAIAMDEKKNKSFVTTATYKKITNNWTVQYNTAYEPQYSAGGTDGLIDGMRGSIDWRRGNWQGFQKTDMDVVVDLKKTMQVSKVMIGFLQDSRAWIVMPKELIIEVSDNGKTYKQIYKGADFLYLEDEQPQVMEMEPSFPATKARYVRIKAKQYGKLPEGHAGAGGDTHIFVDEIQVQ